MGDSWISLKWTNGIDGEDGQDGSNGKNGKDGVSCNIIYQDSDSLKIFCGTDTTSFFIGGTETKSSNGTQKILIEKRDGKQYRTISLGKQTWMAENLNYDYNEGSAQSICYEEEGGCEQYGCYYTRAAAVDSAAIFSKNAATCGYDSKCGLNGNSIIRGVRPNGWRLPSTKEWLTLRSIMGTPNMWWSDTNIATSYDSYGFSVIVSGQCTRNGSLGNDFSCHPVLKTTSGGLVQKAYFWSSDEYDYTYAYYWGLSNNYFDWDVSGEMVGRSYKHYALSIRCIKDDE